MHLIISHHARLGKNLTIFHDVTIGVNENEETFPGDIIIEDDVLIGAGAKIIGKCKIGRGSKIGANALIVSETIPEYSLVVAPKAIIIPSKFKTSTATD
jgi:serine O-acetyltransferase